MPKASFTQPTLYVSVQGSWRASNFTIVYSVSQPIQIADGQPQYAFVHKGAYALFSFHAQSRASIQVSVNGNTKVYVGTTAPVVPSNIIWQSTFFSGGLTIPASTPYWPASNQFYLSVLGVYDSYFLLSVSLNGTATTLSDGSAIEAHVDQDDNAYYTYHVGTIGCQLQFIVSAISGDPDLFVSQSVRKPNPSSCSMPGAACNSSDSYGADQVTFDPAPLGDYFVAVNGYTDSSFTILAQTVCPQDSYNSSSTILTDGVSQHGALPAHIPRYYSFVAPAYAADITFSLVARVGDPDMYIRNDNRPPSRWDFQWSASHIGSDTIVIRSTDTKACVPGSDCRYYIYVYAYSDCDFYIMASTPVQQILLYEGQPQRNSLEQGQLQYYAISIYARSWRPLPLVISVTDLGAGNPDMVVSRRFERPDPNNATTYEWSSARWHDDAINILPGTPGYCMGQCVYYVGVVAQTATTYSIVFHMDQPTTLVDGVPQQGNVPAIGYNFYAFRVNPGYGMLQVSFVSRVGYANLYVSNNEAILPVGSNPASYQEYVPWYRGASQLIVIHEGGPGSCVPINSFPRYCTYVIGVQGFSNCSYTISGSLGAQQLRSGIPALGQVSHTAWQYYFFQVSGAGQNLAVTLTATSGDPDLYISTVALPTRTPGNYNWSSTHSGGDSVSVTNAPVSMYWIGVYGWSMQNSTFSVVATLTDPSGPGGLGDITSLLDGEQQNGLAQANQYVYYSIRLTGGVSFDNLFIALTKMSGDPDLYVRWDANDPTILPVASNPASFSWKASQFGDDTINLPNPQSGVYTIGVLAFAAQSQFAISASTGRAFQNLADGVPRRGAVQATKYSYFRVYMNAPTATDLTITVTPFSGDPDLYVTTDPIDHPNTTNAYWHSSAFRSDAVTIAIGQQHACTNCWYYVGVYGFFSSTFLITANFGNEQQVLESVPVDGTVTVGQMMAYSFDMQSIGGGAIQIDCTATNGLPSLYVSMSAEPTSTSFDYSAPATFAGSHLTLDAATACGLPTAGTPCFMHIGVHGDWSSGYTLLVTWQHSGRNINLINGRSASGSLAAGAYEYYMINVPDSGMDLVVTVQPFSGDADLYMSNDVVNGQQPNSTNWMWRGLFAGTDTVSLHSTPPGPYFIAVKGFSATQYSVTAYAYYENTTSVPILLTDGIPASAVIARGDFMYYSFYLTNEPSVGHHADLLISLSNSLGDPDLFVTNDGTFPTRTHYQWASTRFGSDQITIRDPPSGHYMMGVYAWSTTVYSIVAVTHEGTLELLAGISFGEDLFQGQTEYFFTTVTDTTKDLTVTVTSLNGDPDLYISRTTERPGPGNYTWSATSWRNDSITIPSSQLTVGRYYIAVTAFLNCSFTVLASYQAQTQLQDGRPQHDAVLKEAQKFYTFRVQYTGNDVSIALTPRSGYARMYVSYTSEPIYTDPTTYSWSSWNPYSSQLIVIPASDPHACQANADPTAFCTYYILVRGVSDCQYDLSAQSGVGGIDLQDGIPSQSTVAAGAYQHFRFWVSNPSADVIFSVTPTTGNPFMYIITSGYDTTGQGASATNYQWKSEVLGGNSITVAHTLPAFQLGEWELSIFGGQSYSAFVVVASTSNSTISLTDGQPLVGRLDVRGSYQYYTFVPSFPLSGFTFSVNPRSGDPDLFISMYPTMPSYTNYVWQASHAGSDMITINGADTRACGSSGAYVNGMACEFIIAVRAYIPCTYTIVVTSAMVTGQLQSGVPVFGTVDAGGYVYYYINVLSFQQPELQISLTAISGDPDLYASIRYDHPNSTNWDWRSLSSGSEQFTIPNPQRAKYYISVYGYGLLPATFALTATFANHVMLAPGLPYSDSISTFGQQKYYTIRLDPSFLGGNLPVSGLTVSLNPTFGGWFDMFLLAGGANAVAAPNAPGVFPALHTDQSGGRSLVVRPNDANACWLTNCTYSLMVRAYTSTPLPYTLTYYFGDDVITLVPAVPFTASVDAGSYTYFRAMVSDFTHDIGISSTQYFGDVELYATQDPDNLPTRQFSNWSASSNSTTGTHISIAKTSTLLTTGYLFIGVYGTTSSLFTLTLTRDNTMLVSGSPFSASCSWKGSVQYYFLNFQAPTAPGPGQPVPAPTDIIFDIAAIRNSFGMPTADVFDLAITTDPGNTKPNMTNAIWHTTLNSGVQFRIKTSDANYCQQSCTYYVAVSCATGYIRGSYEITASTSDELEVINIDNAAAEAGSVTGTDAGKFYEVYMGSATNFSFILEPCVGEVDLFASEQYNRPDLTHNEWAGQSRDTADVFSYKPAGQPVNKVFFGVWQPAGYALVPNSEFRVRASYVDESALIAPAISHRPLTIKGLSDGVIRFTLVPAVSMVGTAAQDLVYSVFYAPASDDSAILYTYCGVAAVMMKSGQGWQNHSVPAGSLPNTPFEIEISGLNSQVTYQFNVLVFDPSPMATHLGRYSAYLPNSAQPSGSSGDGGTPSGSTSNKVLLGIGIPLGIFVVALLAYLWFKNRKLSKELSIEMHESDIHKAHTADTSNARTLRFLTLSFAYLSCPSAPPSSVPAAALRKAARGAPSASSDDLSAKDRAKNFHKLLQDETPDSSDDYVAPGAGVGGRRVPTAVDEL